MKKTPPPARIPLEFAAFLADSSVALAKVTQRALVRAMRPRRGETLRPGPDTPLWNALIPLLREQCTRYGDKARLARLLGVPRQRVHDYLKGRSALPDAERTLLLLYWLHARQQGRDVI